MVWKLYEDFWLSHQSTSPNGSYTKNKLDLMKYSETMNKNAALDAYRDYIYVTIWSLQLGNKHSYPEKSDIFTVIK